MRAVTNTKRVRDALRRVAEAATEDTPSFLGAVGVALSYATLLCDDVDFLQVLIADLKEDSAAYQRGREDGLHEGRLEGAADERTRRERFSGYPSLSITDRTENLP